MEGKELQVVNNIIENYKRRVRTNIVNAELTISDFIAYLEAANLEIRSKKEMENGTTTD